MNGDSMLCLCRLVREVEVGMPLAAEAAPRTRWAEYRALSVERVLMVLEGGL